MASPPQRPEGLNPANDHESRAGTVIAVAVTFAVLSTFLTTVRLYTRTRVLGTFHMDDVAIICAQVIAIVVSVISGIETQYGLGHHTWVTDPADSSKQLQLLYGVILGYNLGLNFVKVGFLILYLRIFSSTALKTVCKWFLGYVLLWTATQQIILALTCLPLAIVAPSMEGSCLDTYTAWLTSSITSTVTDFVIIALPLPMVVKLRLRLKQKVIAVLMFSLGFFTCAISIIRILTLQGAITARDPTWDNVEPGCWSIVEVNCAIICHNLPVIRLLLVRYLPFLGMDPDHTGRAGTYSGYGHSRRPPTAGTSRTRHGSGSEVSRSGDEEEGGSDSSDNPKVVARCFSGRWKGGSQIELTENKNGMGQILVTTDTTITSDQAPARGPRPQASFSWEERTLGGESSSRS